MTLGEEKENPGKSDKPGIYKPRQKISKPRERRPLYVNLDSPQMPDLRARLDVYLESLGYEASEYLRWLISKAIKEQMRPENGD